MSLLAHRVTTETTPARDLLFLAAVGSEDPVGCSAYASFLTQVQELEEYVDGVLALPSGQRPPPGEWYQYVCERLSAAAYESFGADGSYRALHLLLDLSGDIPASGLFGPATVPPDYTGHVGAEVLEESTYVSRVYERSRHGEGILPGNPTSDDWYEADVDPVPFCKVFMNTLVDEWDEGKDTYPDRESFTLQASAHRYYHVDFGESVTFRDDGERGELVRLSDAQAAGETPVSVGLLVFGQVTRVPDGFPYERMFFSTVDEVGVEAELSAEPCPALEPLLPMLWSELDDLEAVDGTDGDDDDSAQP